jgi:hypothetical protein
VVKKKCPIHGDNCPGDDGGFLIDGNHPDDMFGTWPAATLKEARPKMNLKEAIAAIEDLINEFPDEIFIEALEEMEDRARSAREAKEQEETEKITDEENADE